MAKTIYEVKVRTGQYTDKNGQTKGRYERIGSVIETKNGPALKIDAIPVCDPPWNGWANLYAPQPQEGLHPAKRDNFTDVSDIPF
jgi:hypothetical protein